MENNKNKLVIERLKQYPNVERIFGKTWIIKKINRGGNHLILDFLLAEPPDYEKINNLMKQLKETKNIDEGFIFDIFNKIISESKKSQSKENIDNK